MEHIVDPQIDKYSAHYSKQEPDYIRKVREFTMSQVPNSQMLSGPLEGNFLKMVVQLTQAKKILELGTYTGYSALWMAEGLAEDGKIITCEASPEHATMSRKHFDESPHAKKIDIKFGPALETLENIHDTFDVVFIDADKTNYPSYYEKAMRLVRSGGSILIDNMLWSGKVLDPQDASSKIIHELNRAISKDTRVTNILVTIRDGIQWVIKK